MNTNTSQAIGVYIRILYVATSIMLAGAGGDTLQIHIDGITKGDKVLIHDDVLATGGTAKAVCNLVERLGGKIVQCNFIIELGFLKGAEELKVPVKSLLTY